MNKIPLFTVNFPISSWFIQRDIDIAIMLRLSCVDQFSFGMTSKAHYQIYCAVWKIQLINFITNVRQNIVNAITKLLLNNLYSMVPTTNGSDRHYLRMHSKTMVFINLMQHMVNKDSVIYNYLEDGIYVFVKVPELHKKYNFMKIQIGNLALAIGYISQGKMIVYYPIKKQCKELSKIIDQEILDFVVPQKQLATKDYINHHINIFKQTTESLIFNYLLTLL